MRPAETERVMNVKHGVIRGTVSLGGARALVSAFNAVGIVILARLLTPADFGIVAISTAVLGVTMALTEASLQPALVQCEAPTREHLDTVWTMALETAIWWTLRKHRPKANLVVDGYGPEGAMALLEAVLAGHVIRSLHLGDRSVDATPHELAKAVRSCLPR